MARKKDVRMVITLECTECASATTPRRRTGATTPGGWAVQVLRAVPEPPAAS